MTKEEYLEAIEEMKNQINKQIPVDSLLQKAPHQGYICPVCGNGTGKDGTGSVKVYKETNTWACHVCFDKDKPDKHTGGDVVKLYRIFHPEKTYSQAVRELGETIGLYLDREAAKKKVKQGNISPTEKPAAVPSLLAKEKKDYTSYYKQCRDRLFASDNSGVPGLDYIEKRGLDLEVCCNYFVGFDPKSDPAGTGHPTPRLIIPTSKYHYIARRVDGKDMYKVMNPKDATPGFFNIKVLKKQDVQEVFICEGAIDALSFLTVGVDAIATNSTANIKRFLKVLEADRPRSEITFIIAMDNDDAGRKAAFEISAGLRRLGLPFIMANGIYGDMKDANEALCKGKEEFISLIEKAKKYGAARPDNVYDYISNFMGADMEHFNRERKTGFPSFDELTGGLYPGLYVLAAISSLGKTDWALQLADQLAEQGEDVLFFSLEMSRLELVSRSIARTIAKEYPEKYNITAVDVRKGRLPSAVLSSVGVYQDTVEDRLSIVEENFEANISSIGDYIRKYIAKTGTRPVVIIDYLQIIQPRDEDARKGKREAIDNTTTELKRLSRELDAPMIVISSVNRANYQTPLSYESLKESGNIEFSADCVFGLQLQCLNEPLFSEEKNTVEKRERVKRAKKENPRKLEFVCLKNRYGESSFSLFFDYYPGKDLFVDMGVKEDEYRHTQRRAGRKL